MSKSRTHRTRRQRRQANGLLNFFYGKLGGRPASKHASKAGRTGKIAEKRRATLQADDRKSLAEQLARP